jgi:hypothetical protein
VPEGWCRQTIGEHVRRETEPRLPMALSSRRITVLKGLGVSEPGTPVSLFCVVASGVVVALSASSP